MIAGVPGDDLDPVRLAYQQEVLAGHLPGGLDGFGSTCREEHPVHVAGGEFGDSRCELCCRGMGVSPDREVSELFGLFAGGIGELGSPVPDLGHEQAGQRIEILLAVLVPHVAAVATLDDHRTLLGDLGEVEPQVVPRHVLNDAHRCLFLLVLVRCRPWLLARGR